MFNPSGRLRLFRAACRADTDSATDARPGHRTLCRYCPRAQPLWRPRAHPQVLQWGGARVAGKALCYLMVYAVMGAYLTMMVPRIFSFLQLATWQSLLTMMVPYVLACVFFGMTVSCLVRYRENVMLLVVFISLPLLFLSGVSWPQSSIPGAWQGVSWLFPSTFRHRAYVRLNTMGATVSDVSAELPLLCGYRLPPTLAPPVWSMAPRFVVPSAMLRRAWPICARSAKSASH